MKVKKWKGESKRMKKVKAIGWKKMKVKEWKGESKRVKKVKKRVKKWK